MSAKKCRRDTMILLFMLAITLAFAERQCELERLKHTEQLFHLLSTLAGFLFAAPFVII